MHFFSIPNSTMQLLMSKVAYRYCIIFLHKNYNRLLQYLNKYPQQFYPCLTYTMSMNCSSDENEKGKEGVLMCCLRIMVLQCFLDKSLCLFCFHFIMFSQILAPDILMILSCMTPTEHSQKGEQCHTTR